MVKTGTAPPTLSPPPAAQPSGSPVIDTLTAGTTLFRVHRSAHPADGFNPTPQPSPDDGGRFDALRPGSYAYSYLGQDKEGALAETLCRDLPDGGQPRYIPRTLLMGRQLTEVITLDDLQMLRLHGPACSQIGSSPALTKCEPREYLTTRAWARALLDWMPNLDGFSYRCRHDDDRIAYVVFDESPARPRAHGKLQARPSTSLALTSTLGLLHVAAVITAHNAQLSP